MDSGGIIDFSTHNKPLLFPSFISSVWLSAWNQGGWEIRLLSYQGHVRSLMGTRSRYSDVCHGYRIDLHKNCVPVQILLALLTNNMYVNIHRFQQLGILIDCLALSVNASLYFVPISNGGSDGLYPSITVPTVAAGHSWSVGVCRHYHKRDSNSLPAATIYT